MTGADDTDEVIRETARRVLTERQLHVWEAWCGGASVRAIAMDMRVDRATVRGHLDAAQRKLDAALNDGGA